MELKELEVEIESIEDEKALETLLTSIYKKMRATQNSTEGGWGGSANTNNS